jgi:hypothetical protein
MVALGAMAKTWIYEACERGEFCITKCELTRCLGRLPPSLDPPCAPPSALIASQENSRVGGTARCIARGYKFLSLLDSIALSTLFPFAAGSAARVHLASIGVLKAWYGKHVTAQCTLLSESRFA